MSLKYERNNQGNHSENCLVIIKPSRIQNNYENKSKHVKCSDLNNGTKRKHHSIDITTNLILILCACNYSCLKVTTEDDKQAI